MTPSGILVAAASRALVSNVPITVLPPPAWAKIANSTLPTWANPRMDPPVPSLVQTSKNPAAAKNLPARRRLDPPSSPRSRLSLL